MLIEADITAQAAAAAGDTRPHAVVIGAGFGGLSAAMRLGARGYRVTVLDRLDAPGGRGSAVVRDGHRFDLGPTIVTVPQVLEDLWCATGRDFHKDVDLRPIDPFYEIRWPDGSRFEMGPDENRVRQQIAQMAPGDLAGYDRFLNDARVRYEFGFEGLGRRPLHEFLKFCLTLPRFGILRADRSILTHARRRFRDPRLQMAFSFHPLFIGGDPTQVTSIYALVGHLEKEFGVHYAMGGTVAIARAMVRVIEAQGGAVIGMTTVDEITTKAGRATGVRLEGGLDIAADIVVSNADVGHTYGRLLRRHVRRRWTDGWLNSRRWSMGLFVWYFGTKGTRGMWGDVGQHTIVNGPRYEGLLRDIFRRGHLADDMSLYIHRPSAIDPSAAPEGDDTFYALSPVPHRGLSDTDWTTETARYRTKVLAELEKVMPGIGARLGPEYILNPEGFETRYLSPHGAGFSLEPRILQSAWFRPHNISEEVDRLFIVGAGTHPGAGLPGVITSAEVTDKTIPAAGDLR
ncbi:MAG: phytoene desaturase family protein [Pseudomonadota bacterium]